MSIRSRSGFTLVEILIAVAIIGGLATLTLVNTSQTRTKARDASRRTTVEAYSTSLEQWRTVSSTKSYFVQMESSTPCNASNPVNTTAQQTGNTSLTGYGYMSGTDQDVCVGFTGGGAGRMTRKNISGKYFKNSIVDALKQAGVLNAVRLDPRLEKKDFNVDDPWADFILTTCNKDGYAAATPADAVNYTIYANLELPNLAPQDEAATARQQCGGDDTGKSWNTVQ
jgi:prepilin-type N-terminal cleavage/methylation domain-containing protein